MTTTPADEMRAAAERARQTGDPLHTGIALLLEQHVKGYEASAAAAAHVWPNSSAAAAAWLASQVSTAALTVARQLLGETTTTTGAQADGLRDRIAEALTASRDTWWQTPPRYDLAANAVLAVLPAPDDRAAILREAANRYAKLADLNEAYDREHGELDETARIQHGAVRDVAAGLRRMADEAQQPTDDEAHPVETEWVVETEWRSNGEWRRHWPARHTRTEAEQDYERSVEQDADYRYRIVRVTTTTTVEQPAPAVTEEPTP